MTMIVYGALANVSIGGLFLGGIVPGILVGFALMLVVYLNALNRGRFPWLQSAGGQFDFRASLKAFVKVWSALLAPVIIVGGILGGVFTATEAGVVACVYSFLIAYFVYRTIRLRDLPQILLDAALTTCMVSGILGIAGGFGWLLAYLNFNQIVLSSILAITHEPQLIFLMLVGVMLVLTMFVDSMAVLIITVPIAVHIGHTFGLDQFQLGVALVMATQIGATTPPVAVLLFVASSIARCPYSETVRYAWTFIFAEILVLLLVVLFQPIAALIPNWAFSP
jgi:tripartite ATP-independent transporter DctM subunit